MPGPSLDVSVCVGSVMHRTLQVDGAGCEVELVDAIRHYGTQLLATPLLP